MISVIVPAYNAEAFLGEALRSVFNERRHRLQVIVVDDGSTDQTAAVARDFPVIYLHTEHAGVAVARNKGLAVATGELLAWVDADDRWIAGRLDEPMAVLAAKDGPDVVYGQIQQFVSRGGVETKLGHPASGRLPGSMLIERKAFDRVGGFDESLRIGEFMDWLVRARRAGIRELALPIACLERRIHGSNLGAAMNGQPGDYLRVARRSFEAS